MASQLNSVAKLFQKKGSTIINSSIVLATTTIEQLITLAVYTCPCVSVPELGAGCNATTGELQSSCLKFLNFSYGTCFLLGPAVGLFVFGITSNINTWKSLTGCLHRTPFEDRDRGDVAWTWMMIISRAFVSPLAWVCVGLLDGRFLACAITPLPYDVDHSSSQFASCEAVAVAKVKYTSNTFNDNRSISQVIGWGLIAMFVFFGFTIYAVSRCTLPLTYYHDMYRSLYIKNEEAEFEDEMQTKTQVNSEENVKRFMSKQRSKDQWDRISTVFEFHRTKKHVALYSQLHEWCLEEDRQNATEETALNADLSVTVTQGNASNDVPGDVGSDNILSVSTEMVDLSK